MVLFGVWGVNEPSPPPHSISYAGYPLKCSKTILSFVHVPPNSLLYLNWYFSIFICLAPLKSEVSPTSSSEARLPWPALLLLLLTTVRSLFIWRQIVLRDQFFPPPLFCLFKWTAQRFYLPVLRKWWEDAAVMTLNERQYSQHCYLQSSAPQVRTRYPVLTPAPP